MPGFDGTGPRGQGSMTGAGSGYCAMPVGEEWEKFVVSGYRGRGRGRRNCFYASGLPGWMRAKSDMRSFGRLGRNLSKEDELSMLKIQEERLNSELGAVKLRVKELESE